MKSLKKWSIITLVLCVLFLTLAIVCTVKPAGFGEWLVLTYEDITCELGYTANGLFSKLAIISYSCLGICFVINQILFLVYIKKSKELKETADNSSTQQTPNTEKKTIFVLPQVKKEKRRKKKEDEEKTEDPTVVQTAKPAAPVSKAEAMKNLLDSFRK